MADTDVLYDVADGVATITLNRPATLNALLPHMGPAYAALLRSADADPEVRAIVVTGAGRGFCSGADLGVLAQGADALEAFASDQGLDELPLTALSISTPVVAAVNGPCAGIGFVLALCSDVRFASTTATFSPTFPRLGLVAEYGSAWLLPRIVGRPAATELLLSGRTVDAAEAAGIGLVHAVVDDALQAARSWAVDVAASCSPRSTATIKKQLRAADHQDIDTAARESLALMRQSFRWPDLPEALMARLERRSPQFAPRQSGE